MSEKWICLKQMDDFNGRDFEIHVRPSDVGAIFPSGGGDVLTCWIKLRGESRHLHVRGSASEIVSRCGGVPE